jgi:photosystem II stability/assembly factor-like uncharacterized protein
MESRKQLSATESAMKHRTIMLITMVIASQLRLTGQNFRNPLDTGRVDVAENELFDGGFAEDTQDKTEQTISDSIHLSSIICATPSTIIAGGDKGVITYSLDGGQSWIEAQTGTVNTIRKMSFLNALVGVAVGDSGLVLLTTDGGRTWHFQPHASKVDLIGVSIADQQRIYAVGRRGTILRSNDSGRTWESISSGAFFSLRSIKNPASTTAIAVGVEGTILRSSDSGNSWRHSFSGTLNDLSDVAFSNGDLGVAVGNVGTIVRTTDGGISWSPIQHPFRVDFTCVAFADVNVAVATASNGTIIRTSDGGLSWQLVMDSSSISLSGASFADSRSGFAAGDNGIILHTNDGGAHWSIREEKPIQSAEKPTAERTQTLVRKSDPASEKEKKSVTERLTPDVPVSKTKEPPPLNIQMGLAKMPPPRWRPFDLPTMLIQIPTGFGGGLVMGLAGGLLGAAIDGKNSAAATIILGGGGAFFGVPAGVYFGGKWMGGNGTYGSTLLYGYALLLGGALLTAAAPPLGVIVMVLSPVLAYHLSASPVYQSDNSALLGTTNTKLAGWPNSGPSTDLRINVISIDF